MGLSPQGIISHSKPSKKNPITYRDSVQSRNIKVSLDNSTANALTKYANLRGLTQNEIVREALFEYLGKTVVAHLLDTQ